MVQLGGLIGLYGGLLMGLGGWYFGRRQAKKQRALDETHDHIWKKARSISWYTTIIAIYILFSLYLVNVQLTIPMILGVLLFIQLGSWGISGIVLTAILYSEKKINIKLIIGYTIIIVSSFGFLLMMTLNKEWFLLTWIVPCIIAGVMFIRQSKV